MSRSNTNNNLSPRSIDVNRPSFHTFDSFIKEKRSSKKVFNEINALMQYDRRDSKESTKIDQRETYCASIDQKDKCILTKCGDISANKDIPPLSLQKDKILSFAGHPIKRDPKMKGRKMFVGGRAVWASGCAVSEKHRFIYVHVLKSGGSTIKSFLRRALCFSLTDTTLTTGDTRGSFLCGQDQVNMKGSDILRAADCQTILKKHPDYFTFSFVRNPFSRMYSSYAMSISKDYKKDVIPSFEGFLMAKHRARGKLSKLSPTHYIPQKLFLFTKGLCPVVDFIGKLENFQEDFGYVLDKINSTKIFKYKEIHGIDKKNTYGKNARVESLGGDLRNAYHKASLVEAVTSEYKDDFIAFGYDPKVVPK